MQTFTLHYIDTTQLLDYIECNNFKSYRNVLIQVFSGIIDEEILLSLTNEIQKQLPNAKILGTTTAGEISNAKMYDSTIQLAFTLFETTEIAVKLFDLEKGFLLEDIERDFIQENTKALIVFSDGLKSNAEELLEQLTQNNPNVVIAGGRAADSLEFKKTFVFDATRITENGFVVASLSGDSLEVNSDYMLNWNQIGKEMIVTKADGNIVYEVDNMKIADLYLKYLGNEIAQNLPSAGTEFPLVTLRNGIKVARSPIATLEDGAFLFGGNLNVGEKVKFAYGNLDDIQDSIYKNSVKFSKLPIESIFIYSCSGRKTLIGKELEAEFEMLNSFAPTVGFFTYGEYFHSSNVNEVLNITTTFLALSEHKESQHDKLYMKKEFRDNRILKALTHLANETTKEIEFKNQELYRLHKMISKSVLYSTSDLDGNIVSISQAYLDFLHLKEEEVIGKNHNIFRHPDTPESFYVKMWGTLSRDKRFVDALKNKRSDGSDYWIKMIIDPIYDENRKKIGYSSYREDITDKKVLEYVSTHDSLTALYNRGEFTKEIKRTLQVAENTKNKFCFMIFDIDHFKMVNDTYGHKIGDDVLIAISRIFSECLDDDEFLARWGGEEFVIIKKNENIETLVSQVKKIQEKIASISFDPVPSVTLSFGLTLYKEGDTKDTLLKRADKALYYAKEHGRNRYEIR